MDVDDKVDKLDFHPKKHEEIRKEADLDEKINKELLKIRDRIKIVDDIKTDPPPHGRMTTTLRNEVYAVDLNTLLNSQIVDCPATVIPMLIDHGVRTAVDIKETYKPEKRVLAFQYWWVIVLIIGGIGMIMLLNMLFGIF